MPFAKALCTSSCPMNWTSPSFGRAPVNPRDRAPNPIANSVVMRMVLSLLGCAGFAAERAGAGQRDGRVTGRARCAAHADGADHLAVHDDRLAAVKRRGP